MKLKDLFEKWGLKGLKVKTPIMDMEWVPNDPDKAAAWDMYVELLTRITTQELPDEAGVEATALESVYALFPLTRETLKTHGRGCVAFSRLAIVILNQIIRPFTAKWHKKSDNRAFSNETNRKEFRKDLKALQEKLIRYTRLLGTVADIEEDLIDIEQ